MRAIVEICFLCQRHTSTESMNNDQLNCLRVSFVTVEYVCRQASFLGKTCDNRKL
jgi:hypothetical protein